MSVSTDEDIILDVDMESEIPCEAAGAESWPDTPGPAKWAAHMACPNCRETLLVLICTDCKEYILKYKGHNSCIYCGHSETSLAAFFTAINPI